MKQTREELEYAISQYLDGTLGLLERNTLEERLAADGEARALLQEYRQLDLSLKSLPMPSIAWDRLATRISHSLESHDPPVRNYTIGIGSWSQRLAIAAVLLLSVSMIAYFIRSPKESGETQIATNAHPTGTAIINGPTAEQAKGAVIAEVTIGPSPSIAQANWRATEDIVSRPTVVLIDQARSGAQDSEQSPY